MSDKKYFWLIASTIIFLTSLPFFITQFIELTTANYYTNYTLIAGSDKAVYLSYMEQARQGQWLFKNLFTSEPQQARLFSPLWLLLGKISLITGLSNIIIFHLARIILAFIFLYLIFQFLKYYFPNIFEKRLVFFFITIASGIGIWPFLVNVMQGRLEEIIKNEAVATDVWVSEANTFLTLLHSPLFILSQILILLIFWLFLKNLNQVSSPKSLLLFFLILFLGIIHPYDLIIISTALATFIFCYFIIIKKILWPILINLFLIALAAFISFLYFYYIFNQEIALKGWLVQNITSSPLVYYYLLGFGLIFIYFIIGILPLLKKITNYYFLFVLCWAISQLSLLYLPNQFQTKLSNGIHLPLSIIAGIGFFWLLKKFNKQKKISNINLNFIAKNLFIQLTIFLLISSNLVIISLEIVNVLSKERPFYLTNNEYQAMQWLKSNIADDQIILTGDKNLGNIVPAITARISYLGHGHQTINWLQKLDNVQWFFQNNDQSLAKKYWLEKERIDYILFVSQEEANGFQPENQDYLTLVFQNQTAKIFQIK